MFGRADNSNDSIHGLLPLKTFFEELFEIVGIHARVIVNADLDQVLRSNTRDGYEDSIQQTSTSIGL